MYFNLNNKEIELRNRFNAQNKKREAYYDKLWKILQQKAEISNEYKDGFKDIYVSIIDGRYSKGDGSLMKFIQEANPNFDVSLYKDLMNEITIQREGFYNEQVILIDIQNEHINLCTNMLYSMFIKNTTPLEFKLIESAKTKQVFETGEENDVELFKKK